MSEYEEGATLRELAARYGCSTTSILSALRRGGAQQRSANQARRLRNPWDASTQDEAIRLYRSGLGVKAVARRFWVRDDVISALLRDRGEPLHPGGRAHPRFKSIAQCEEVAELYRSGLSLSALAERLDCSTPTITKALKRAGVDTRSTRPVFWTPERLARLAELHAQGLSQSAIGKELGVSQTVVGGRLRAEGIIPPSTRPTGPDSPRWRGGRHVNNQGYAYVRISRDDPMWCMTQPSNAYVAEHRLAMARALGRPLQSDESVHHINGDRLDNRLENLQVRQGKHGKGVVFTCNSCGSHDVTAQELAT
ncbi:MAG: HNH endonuclease [Vicinamibacterales bacterium]